MSEAEKANQESDVYLKQVRLKNYKSIIDAEIDFKPGLNIIIGNNGSGKTNFLSYLNNVLEVNWQKENISADLTFIEKENIYNIVINKKSEFSQLLNLNSSDQVNSNVQYSVNDNSEFIGQVNSSEFKQKISEIHYHNKMIHYGIPSNDSLIESSMHLLIAEKGGLQTSSWQFSGTKFLKSVFYYFSSILFYKDWFGNSSVKEIIEGLNDFFNDLKLDLNSFTDIKGLRISPNYNLHSTNDFFDSNKSIMVTVSNLFLEFNTNGNWMPYSTLSDGNKRLFYIFSEVVAANATFFLNKIPNQEFTGKLIIHNDIILLEEPELGIHPHQLHKLMLFIKEQSKTKQIILTTHSPQVLNILNADELDRIIVCNYDQQLGTQLNHLTERQIEKGKLYMQDEGFLSDYWVHSDLEPIN